MRRLDYSHYYHWLILAVVLLLIVWLSAAFLEYTQDDVFITYTFSRNIAEGHGFVFYQGERVQGSTTPLWALLMAGVYLITPDLLHAGNAISGFLLAIAILLAFTLTKPYLSRYTRLAICVIVATSPLIYVSFGMETLLYTALLMFSFWQWSRGRKGWALLGAGLLTWTRADGLVLGGVLGILALLDVLQAKPGRFSLKALPWRLAGIYVLSAAPWFIFALLYFGSPLPNTFSAKQELFRGIEFWLDGFRWWRAFYGNNWLSLIAAPLIILGLIRTWSHISLRPLLLWTALYTLAYTLLNITMFWYYTPLLVSLVILAAFGGEWLVRRWLLGRLPRAVVLVSLSVVVVISAGLSISQALEYAEPPPRVRTYTMLGTWIDQNTAPHARLLVSDLGIVGYYANRSTLDVPGLIVPDMLFRWNEDYAVTKYRPDLVATTQYWTWARLVEQPWFHEYYKPIVQVSSEGDEFSPMTVFERRYPLANPERIPEGFDLALFCDMTLQSGQSVPDTTGVRIRDSSGNTVVDVGFPFLQERYPVGVASAEDAVIQQVIIPLDLQTGSYEWEMLCDEPLRGEFSVVPVETLDAYTPATDALWPDLAQLAGVVAVDGTDTWSGGALTLAFHWKAAAEVDTDYSVYVHVVNQQGELVAQDDGYPRAGRSPTSGWQIGDTIVDVRELVLPPGLPTGAYRIAVGWYDWQTSERLPLVNGDDAFVLPLTINNTKPPG